MSSAPDIPEALTQLIREILENYEERVPETGPFRDLKAGTQVAYGDPDTTMPGHLEIVVMHMNAQLDPAQDRLRFVSVRVRKGRGGIASSTCFHGTKQQLDDQLRKEADRPILLECSVRELSDGLPEETNPDNWR